MASNYYPAHEGLQVDVGAYHENANATALPDKSWKEVSMIQPSDQWVAGHDAPEVVVEEKRYFGLPRRTFWIVFGLVCLLVVMAAAVGGGVGGSLANKSKNARYTSQDLGP